MQSRWRLAAFVITILAGSTLWPPHRAHTQGGSCLVTTQSGAVQGLDNGSSCAFLGVPFAAPPVGPLRWRPPQAPTAWAPATLNVTTPSSTCALVNPPSTTPLGNEDCLRLNIWAPDPAPASPAPVIVWIHPGGFVAASANLPAHNGRQIAERTGAIVVAANYRVGPFGFLAHPALTAEDPTYRSSGNYGFLDQRAALEWVRDHIGAFGGDPNNVTIGGQSAGGHSVSLHMVAPRSAGYFHRAIMQSGYASSRWNTLADGEALGRSLASALGCTVPSEVLTCLRSKTREQVLLALPAGQQQFSETARAAWGPVVDGLEIPDQPRLLYQDGHFSHVPLILGATRDEGWNYADRSFPAGLTEEQYHAAVETEFGTADAPAIRALYPSGDFRSPKHALSRLAGDVEAACEVRRVARLVSRTRTPVYVYSFEREVVAVAGDQVVHGMDTNFMFGNNYAPPTSYVLSGDDLVLSGSIMELWARFAATGSPEPPRRPRHHEADVWPKFNAGAGKYIVLDVPIEQDKRFRDEQCDFWESRFLRSVVGSVPAAAPISDLCGATIAADLKLDHDVACQGSGPNVGADGIKVDLNGHTISGSGVGNGIDVTGRTDVTISGGIIRNFFAGVRILNSTDIVVRQNVLQGNTDGVDVQSGGIGNTIAHNDIRDSLARGIMFRSNTSRNTVRDNMFTGNRVGVLVFGGVDNVIRSNVVSGSGLAGIRFNILAAGNVVRRNTIVSNPAGVEFLITPTGSATGNTVVQNTLATNACGVKGRVEGNTIAKNRFDGNAADRCD